MATIRDRCPELLEVRAFSGSDTRSSPRPLSRAVAGLGDILKGDAK